MSIQIIHKTIKNCHHQIEKITKNEPVTAIIYSIATKIFSAALWSFSSVLGACFLLLSLSFDISIITNLDKVSEKIKSTFSNIIRDLSPEPEYSYEQEEHYNFSYEHKKSWVGSHCKHYITKYYNTLTEFFKNLLK